MFYKNLNIQFNKLYKLSLKKKKIVLLYFQVLLTILKKYLTPIRESSNAFYMGAVIYDDFSAKKIVDIIKKKVHFVFVDTEKKTKKQNLG